MKIKYLGTAAAEGVPALFCRCPVCEKSRSAGGRNIRSRSQAIIDDTLLIDYPPDSFMHFINDNIDLISISACILTHCHSDHLYTEDFEMRKPGFAHFGEGRDINKLTVYASEASAQPIFDVIERHNIGSDVLGVKTVKPFEPFEVEGYTVTPLKADHDRSTDPLFYSVEKDGKALLYANDTGYFPQETWDYLEKTKPVFDFVSLDCTGCIVNYRQGHMGLEADSDVKARMLDSGLANENTVFCCHHFSHNGLVTYDEFVPLAEEKGFLVSYDSMEYEF